MGARSGGCSNLSYLDKRLKDKAFRNYPKFTDADEELIGGIRHMIQQGTMAKKVAQTIKREFEKILDPMEMIAILRKHVRVVDDATDRNRRKERVRREVILSGYLIAGDRT